MSSPSDSSSLRKRKSEDDAQAPVDHRKRRRNRTTQSCLNCHGSKRMCDRKRPACSRCVKLGLSGICVYEVDDASQREPDNDETSHLKNRIAELEGFIREYKRKPHPRWTTEPKKASHFSASSPLAPDTGSEAEFPIDVKDSSSYDSNDSVTSASSPSEFVPATPPAHNDEPVFLTGQDSASPFLFSGAGSLSSLHCDTSFDLVSGASASNRDCTSDMLRFDNAALPGEDNEIFERVFSQILRHDACGSADAENACECMKKSSAYSVVLALAPHVRRALDALGALPEHRASRLGESCKYLKHVQDLESAISSVVESVSTSLSTPSTYSLRTVKLPIGIAAAPTVSTEDSPLQRVLAARRTTISQSSFPFLTPHAPNALNVTQKQVREDSLLWGLRDRSSSVNLVEHSEADQFMSWDPPSRLSWPRTISL